MGRRTVSKKTSKETEVKPQGLMSLLAKPLPSRNPDIDIDAVLSEINKEFGEGTLRRASDDSFAVKRPRLSTGSLAIDYLLGGLAKGNVHTVSGDSSVGKSHLCLKAIAWYQRKFPNEMCVLIDAEGSYEETFAIMAGIDLSKLVIYQPESLEEAYKIARRLQKAGAGLIVIDSVEGLATEKDLDTDEGEKKQMGEKQKMSANFLKVFINRNNSMRRQGNDGTTLLLVLQLKEKIGIAYGDPLFETGGRGFQYMPHTKIRLMESGKERDPKSKVTIRSTITAVIKKSRQTQKDISITYYFNFQEHEGVPVGIDHYEELISIAMMEGLIEPISQQKVLILGETECKTKEVKRKLLADPDLLQELYLKVMDIIHEKLGHKELLEEGETDGKETVGNEPKRDRGRTRRKNR